MGAWARGRTSHTGPPRFMVVGDRRSAKPSASSDVAPATAEPNFDDGERRAVPSPSEECRSFGAAVAAAESEWRRRCSSRCSRTRARVAARCNALYCAVAWPAAIATCGAAAVRCPFYAEIMRAWVRQDGGGGWVCRRQGFLQVVRLRSRHIEVPRFGRRSCALPSLPAGRGRPVTRLQYNAPHDAWRPARMRDAHARTGAVWVGGW